MSETSLHHCESDIALWNKAELQVFSHQRSVIVQLCRNKATYTICEKACFYFLNCL